MRIRSMIVSLVAMCSTLVGVGTASAASDIENACTIFQEKSAWHVAAHAASEKWDVPMSAILAVIRQESRFKATAAARHSTAYGFAQVLDGTWAWYREATRASGAVRTNFADSADFIGWYMANTQKRIGLPVDDVASHYLAYHEGHVGYRSARWEENTALIGISEKVAKVASRYEEQLRTCSIAALTDTAPVYSFRPAAKPFALVQVAATMPKRKPDDRLVAAAFIETSRIQ